MTIESPRRCCSSRSVSSTWRCTITSSAVTGSSAISRLGIERQRERDADALAHAAGELVRIVALAAADRARPCRTARRCAPAHAGSACSRRARPAPRRSARRPDRPDRARSSRFAARRRSRATARRAFSASSIGADRGLRTAIAPPATPGVARHHADDGARQRGLAAAGFADEPDDLCPPARRSVPRSTARASAAARGVVDLAGPRARGSARLSP